MIGYPAHGRGPLAPDEPTVICSTCHGKYWYESDLNEDGDCHDCVSQSEENWYDGEAKFPTTRKVLEDLRDHTEQHYTESEPDEPGTDYPMDIYTNSADAELNRSTMHGIGIILNL